MAAAKPWAGDRDRQAIASEAIDALLRPLHPVDRAGALGSSIVALALMHADDEADALAALDALTGDMRDALVAFYAHRRGAH